MKRIVAAAFFVFLALGIALETQTGFFTGLLTPLTVAVIDTEKPEKSAQLVSRACAGADCRILPLALPGKDSVATPAAMAAAIRAALAGGARLISIGAGCTERSNELEAAVGEAVAKKVVIVAAAGTGMGNRLRGVPLGTIYPQAYPDVIVVGAARTLDDFDPSSNFGDQLDVLVTRQPSDLYGSRYAAAAVSGELAKLLKTYPRIGIARVRAAVRSATSLKKFRWVDQEVSEVTARAGFGEFEPEALPRGLRRLLWPERTVRTICDSIGNAESEIGSVGDYQQVTAQFDCPDPLRLQTIFGIQATALPKARIRLKLFADMKRGMLDRLGTLENCPVKVEAKTTGGSTETFDVRFNWR